MNFGQHTSCEPETMPTAFHGFHWILTQHDRSYYYLILQITKPRHSFSSTWNPKLPSWPIPFTITAPHLSRLSRVAHSQIPRPDWAKGENQSRQDCRLGWCPAPDGLQQCCTNWKSRWYQKGVSVRSPVLALTVFRAEGKELQGRRGAKQTHTDPVHASEPLTHQGGSAPHPICQHQLGQGRWVLHNPLPNHKDVTTAAQNSDTSKWATNMKHCGLRPAWQHSCSFPVRSPHPSKAPTLLLCL